MPEKILRLIGLNKEYLVSIANLERNLDEAHFRNGQYFKLFQIFENRYPGQHKDVMTEYNKSIDT